jgi:hypothetical protein
MAIPASAALTLEVVWREVLDSGRPLSENAPAIAGGLVSVVFGSLSRSGSPASSPRAWSAGS